MRDVVIGYGGNSDVSLGRRLLRSVGTTVGTGRTNGATLSIVHVIHSTVHGARVSNGYRLSSTNINTIVTGRVGRHGRSLTRFRGTNHDSLIRRAGTRVTMLRGCVPGRLATSRVHRVIGSTITNRDNLGVNSIVGLIVPGIGNGTSNGLISRVIQRVLRGG